MSRLCLGMSLLAVAAGAAGCGSSSTPEAAGDPATVANAKPIRVEKRTTTAGRWHVMIAQEGHEKPVAVVDVTLADGKSAAKLVSGPDGMKVAGATIEPERLEVRLEIESQNQKVPLDFLGTLSDGVVRGNVLLGNVQCVPAWMDASEAPSPKEPKPIPDSKEFDAARKAGDPARLLAFAQAHPESPLAQDAYEHVLATARDTKIDEEGVKAAAAGLQKAAERWGPRMELLAKFKAPLLLAVTENQPELALSMLDEFDKAADDKTPLAFLEGARAAREMVTGYVHVRDARRALAGDDEALHPKARADLEKVVEANPFNVIAIHDLARFDERQGRKDEALAGYSRLAAIPMMERALKESSAREGEELPAPEESARKLWTERNGTAEGFEAHLDDVLSRWTAEYVSKNLPARADDDGNRVVLVELFTALTCPQCVAADLAVSGLSSGYEPSRVLALRYHLHIPAQDQLANEDSEARFFSYRARETPLACVNGIPIAGVSGLVGDLGPSFARLVGAVDHFLSTKTGVTLALEAAVAEGILKVKAAAGGLPEDSTMLRLRMAIAEERIAVVASNGSRVHEMVVRSMPGGAGGVAVKDGKLEFSEEIKLAAFRQKLVDYLASYEEKQNIEFPNKPLALDKLHFVAFVQNDKTREILQAASIPVSGVIEYPKKGSKSEPPKSEPPKSEPPKSEPPKSDPPKVE